jgi:Spy/CpxP family protein refolding chaperone
MIISHLKENKPTLLKETAERDLRLQKSFLKKSVTETALFLSSIPEASALIALTKQQTNKTMTKKIITLTAACALAFGGLTYLWAGEHGGPRHHRFGNPLEHLSEKLDLTAEQKTKVEPIIEQTRPQIAAIHQEAMEKMRAVMESAGTQIRPLLNAQQQEKFDAMKKAHEDMHKAMQDMREAEKK